jgi:hypothetical protein
MLSGEEASNTNIIVSDPIGANILLSIILEASMLVFGLM